MLIIDCKFPLCKKSLLKTKMEEKHSPLVPPSYCVMPLAAVWIVSMQPGPFSHYFTAICHQRISLPGVDFTATTLCKLYSAETGRWRKSERRGRKKEGGTFFFFRGMWYEDSPRRRTERETIKPKEECGREKDQDRDIESREQERTAETSGERRWRRLGSLR